VTGAGGVHTVSSVRVAHGEFSIGKQPIAVHWRGKDVIFGIRGFSIEVTTEEAVLMEQPSEGATAEDASLKGKHSVDVTATGIAFKE